jgi:hypothetical protein
MPTGWLSVEGTEYSTITGTVAPAFRLRAIPAIAKIEMILP